MTQDLLDTVPVRVVKEKVPSLVNKGEVYIFQPKAIKFFEVYARTMDVDAAFLAAEIDSRRRSEFLQNPYVVNEIDQIQKAWSLQHRMTAGFAAGTHQRLMGKFENEYDSQNGKVKASFAGHLAKMSEAAMKATGLIGKDSEVTVPTVNINIDLGGSQEVKIVDAGKADNA